MAVYTRVSGESLQEFLLSYDLGEVLGFKGIAEGVENSNFLLQTDKGRFILTLYEKRVEEKDLPFFLALMTHLRDQGVACPAPIVDKRGQACSVLEGRPAALMQFLEGISVNHPAPAHCRQVGHALAQLHMAAQDFSLRRANRLGIASWRALLEASERKPDSWPPDLRGELHGVMDVLEDRWPGNLPEGIVHADLFPDNVLFRSEMLEGVIDFYFACQDALAYDIAVCINAWCFSEHGNFMPENAGSLFSGYQEVRRLENSEVEALPILCLGAAMRFLLTRLHDWIHHVDGSLVSPKDPREFLAKLRFHGGIASASEYGLKLQGIP